MSAAAVTFFLTDAAPLAGRLAFAGVFLALTVWLLLMPKSLLGESDGSEPKPVWRQTRSWAVAIAVMQMLVYLFWN